MVYERLHRLHECTVRTLTRVDNNIRKQVFGAVSDNFSGVSLFII
jgi:hypothetical protein